MDPLKLKEEMEKTGKFGAFQNLAASEEAMNAAAAVDPDALRRAVEKEDPAVMRAVMEQLLSTDAGKQLARKVKAAMENG